MVKFLLFYVLIGIRAGFPCISQDSYDAILNDLRAHRNIKEFDSWDLSSEHMFTGKIDLHEHIFAFIRTPAAAQKVIDGICASTDSEDPLFYNLQLVIAMADVHYGIKKITFDVESFKKAYLNDKKFDRIIKKYPALYLKDKFDLIIKMYETRDVLLENKLEKMRPKKTPISCPLTPIANT